MTRYQDILNKYGLTELPPPHKWREYGLTWEILNEVTVTRDIDTNEIIPNRVFIGNTLIPEKYETLLGDIHVPDIAIPYQDKSKIIPTNVLEKVIYPIKNTVNELFHKNPPLNITDTRRITGDETVGGNNFIGKMPAIFILLILAIIAFLHIRSS